MLKLELSTECLTQTHWYINFKPQTNQTSIFSRYKKHKLNITDEIDVNLDLKKLSKIQIDENFSFSYSSCGTTGPVSWSRQTRQTSQPCKIMIMMTLMTMSMMLARMVMMAMMMKMMMMAIVTMMISMFKMGFFSGR